MKLRRSIFQQNDMTLRMKSMSEQVITTSSSEISIKCTKESILFKFWQDSPQAMSCNIKRI